MRYANKLYSTANRSTIQRSSSTHSSGYDGPYEHIENLDARVGEQCRSAIGIRSRNSQKGVFSYYHLTEI